MTPAVRHAGWSVLKDSVSWVSVARPRAEIVEPLALTVGTAIAALLSLMGCPRCRTGAVRRGRRCVCGGALDIERLFSWLWIRGRPSEAQNSAA